MLKSFKKGLEGSQTVLVSRLADGDNNVSKYIFDFLGLKEFEQYLHKERSTLIFILHFILKHI